MVTKKRKILIFTYTDLERDPIVLNQINWLCQLYDLYVICNAPIENKQVKFIKYPTQSFLKRNIWTLLLKFKLFRLYTWNKTHRMLVNEIDKLGFELIIVHHLKLLPLAISVSRTPKILFYAHEYYMSMYDHSLWWRIFIKPYFRWIADNYMQKCDYTITVTESIKNLYENKYNIKADYIQNRVDWESIEPSGIDPLNIRILHHGLASTSRRLELMVELMKYLDNRFNLTLILQSNSFVNDIYIKEIKKLASRNPRIKFKELVKNNEIIKMGNEYDIGIFIMPPTTINEKYSLAHKIFQYIQSRLMLVVSPLPEMKNIVDKYNLGIYQEDYDIKKLADKLNRLTSFEIGYYKNQSDKYAFELGNESAKRKFLDIIVSLIN